MAKFGEVMLGKGIVWAKDTPNFIGNRIGIQGIGKVLQVILEDGILPAEADALFGAAMGRPKTAIFVQLTSLVSTNNGTRCRKLLQSVPE